MGRLSKAETCVRSVDDSLLNVDREEEPMLSESASNSSFPRLIDPLVTDPLKLFRSIYQQEMPEPPSNDDTSIYDFDNRYCEPKNRSE